jgi:hypothetical protein
LEEKGKELGINHNFLKAFQKKVDMRRSLAILLCFLACISKAGLIFFNI